MSSKADKYRAKAVECTESAAKARDPYVRAQFQELARQWWEMAEQVEKPR
jgi:hypothetical protein